MRGDIEECRELELLRLVVGFVNEVRPVPVRLHVALQPRLKHVLIEFPQESALARKSFIIDIGVVLVGDVEGGFEVRQGRYQGFRADIVRGFPH